MVVGGAAVMAGDASIHGGQAGTHASGEFVLFHFRDPLLFLSSSFAPREKSRLRLLGILIRSQACCS